MTNEDFQPLVTANTRRELGVVEVGHEFLLRANRGYWCAWGHDWRRQKEAHSAWYRCERCDGTGQIAAAFSGTCPSCPDCDGEGRCYG